jgi:hypothetical protein
MLLPAGFSTTTESQLRDILAVVAAALQRVRESHERNASRDSERAYIIARRREINSDRMAHPYDPALSEDAKNSLGPGNDEDISGSDEKQAQLPLLPISPAPIVSRRGVEEAVDDLPIVLITNYQPQGAKREELLNVLAEWAAKLVEDKVSVP